MRNQFRKPKNCELRHSLYTEKLSLQVIYANEVSIYDLQRCMNSAKHYLWQTNTTSPLISSWQHLSVGTAWTAVKYKCKTANFGRGGFHIRPSAIHKIMVIFNVCFLFRKNVISATVEYFYRYSCFQPWFVSCSVVWKLRSLMFACFHVHIP